MKQMNELPLSQGTGYTQTPLMLLMGFQFAKGPKGILYTLNEHAQREPNNIITIMTTRESLESLIAILIHRQCLLPLLIHQAP